ncbi:Protein of uncharacterised function (DUF968) [Serratia proteamaculans]|uniref:DUF968 domain-containing protein n=1 Tax=Serratia proteamaculans TaxID=28151 RepID=UPI00217AFC80|nr:DUF968 domain-containing protein [Serratia proteamaculans]CAI0837465.1 Protein of uncharacterised function (DUF968) [Serratia proteamaculans]CAI1624994.1 Protein of uncharacterised function (DUF968) [Serratia proteamaculans]
MRGILKPIVVRELGQVILKPGTDLLPMFGDRVMVATIPAEFRELPSGALPATEQQLAIDPRFRPFFQHKRVLDAAGGINSLESWLDRRPYCQRQCGEDDYHDKNMETMRYGSGAIRLCWHHSHLYRDKTMPELSTTAEQNIAEFVVYRACSHFMFEESHQLTLPELCWWAWVMELTDLLPEDVAAASLRMKPYTMSAGVKREADITHTPAARQIVAEKAKKAAKTLVIDPAPPKSFMKIPKHERWESKTYLKWVRSQLCVIHGVQADDAHHIIGHCQGGMGTKAHDLFTIPLCRKEHDALHRDPSRWEAEHGSQIDLWFRFIDYSLSIGVIN